MKRINIVIAAMALAAISLVATVAPATAVEIANTPVSYEADDADLRRLRIPCACRAPRPKEYKAASALA